MPSRARVTALTIVTAAPALAAPASGSPFVSRSGDRFAFCSTATNLVAGDAFGNCDSFLWSRS